ncbi:MAG TPA: hypothetical protein VNO31_27335 [Umezawaea sp.]|nr:hypothetical protein [Umezawaea sp.]
MSSDTNVSGLFASALGTEPAPAAAPAAKSSCCGPKPEAKAEEAAAPKASSCCGPKPAATAEAAPKAKSSCCG